MAKGKKKVKAATLKRSKGAEKSAPLSKHDRKAVKTAASTTVAEVAVQKHDAGSHKVVGFTNLGNTCFFNSVLQVGSTHAFRAHISLCVFLVRLPQMNADLMCYLPCLTQVMVASPPLHEFFSQPKATLHQGPLASALQEVFEQTQTGSPKGYTNMLVRADVYVRSADHFSSEL